MLTVTHASFGGARLAISLHALHLDASALVIGVLMSLMMVIPTFASVAVGRWVDRAGPIPVMRWSVGGIVAGELLVTLLPSLYTLGAASVLVGTCFMFAHVAINNAIGHEAGVADRTRAFGFMAVGFSLSALVGPMIAGLAIDHLGHRWAFALLAVLPVLAWGLLLRTPLSTRARPAEQASTGGVRDLVRSPGLRAVLVVSAMISAGWDLFTFLVPLHGARNGLSATAIGMVAGAFGVGSAAVRLALPWITQRVTEWKLLAFALVLAAIGYIAFPFCTTVGTMLPLGLALGLVLGCGQPVVMSLLHLTAPNDRTGEAAGLRTAITSMGQMLLPLAFGAFGTALGMAPLFWVAAGLLGFGGGYAATRPRLQH